MADVRDRLRAVQETARRQADRAGWRWEKDGPHPVFAALAEEVLSILAGYGLTVTSSQARTIRWIARDEMDTLADVVELMVTGRDDLHAACARARVVPSAAEVVPVSEFDEPHKAYGGAA